MLRGMSTDEEQDLLRAMLVTAAPGLDAMTKQLIRDALPKVVCEAYIFSEIIINNVAI
jgi:hypothetical protein